MDMDPLFNQHEHPFFLLLKKNEYCLVKQLVRTSGVNDPTLLKTLKKRRKISTETAATHTVQS
jgi:hypothetical protein